MRVHLAAVALLVCLTARSGLAEGQLSIRLVKATNTEAGSPAGIKDVIAVLAKSLRYKSYRLVASANTQLPARKSAQRLGGYTV